MKPSEYRALPSQAKRLAERRSAISFEKIVSGIPVTIAPGVYQTSGDSELMTECVDIKPNQKFLEIGCGCGFVSLVIAQKTHSGVAVDINERAIQNSQENAHNLGIKNIQFIHSDLFSNVQGTFDVIICNPPYTDHPSKDAIDCMFWDENNSMKDRFFKEASRYLNANGRIYFGWANFADLDIELPYKLAAQYGYSSTGLHEKRHKDNFSFYVIEFMRSA